MSSERRHRAAPATLARGPYSIVLRFAATAACALASGGCDSTPAPPSDDPLARCEADRDCQDGDLCDGVERCVAGACVDAEAVTCRPGLVCVATGECDLPPIATPAPCATPRAPLLPALPRGFRLPVTTDDGAPLEVGLARGPALAPDAWRRATSLELPRDGDATVTVFARAIGESDPRCELRAEVALVDAYPGSADDPQSGAVAIDDPRIAAWAAGWSEPIARGADLDPGTDDPRCALGPATGDPLDTASLGNGGALTMVMPFAVEDGPGPEFAIFENGFSDQFLELAFVEVSSDGEHFARFDSLALDMAPVGPYATLDASRIAGLAGHFRAGFGTPFDLADLRVAPAVQSGLVDLSAIAFVRVVDIVGDGLTTDSFGHPIYDPTPVWGTAGFDLDAIAILGAR